MANNDALHNSHLHMRGGYITSLFEPQNDDAANAVRISVCNFRADFFVGFAAVFVSIFENESADYRDPQSRVSTFVSTRITLGLHQSASWWFAMTLDIYHCSRVRIIELVEFCGNFQDDEPGNWPAFSSLCVRSIRAKT